MSDAEDCMGRGGRSVTRQAADVIFALELDLKCAAGTHTPAWAVPGRPVFAWGREIPAGAWWCRHCGAILRDAAQS